MNRIALAKRLGGLSSVFASHTPFSRDLQAMSYVLNKMSDDKFKTILSGDFSSEEMSTEEVNSCMCGKGPFGPGADPAGEPGGLPEIPGSEPKVIIIKKEEELPMSVEATDKTAGMYWSREASKAVVDNLLRDVVGMTKTVCCDTGAKLESEQIPDGTHKGIPEKPSTLKPEQTPDIEKSLDSGIVEKSHGKVEKEASIEDIKKKKEEEKKKKALKVLEGKKASEEEGEKAEQKAEKKEDEALKDVEKAKDKLEEAKEEEKKAEKEEGEKDAASENSSIIEGIELVASLDEIELDANEAAELSKLFE